jgi:hypothetical protein
MARRDATGEIDGLAALLGDAPKKKGRSRKWERKHPTVSFRHWPPGISRRINRIAKELQVPVSEVARLLMEHGLDAYDAGELKARPGIVSHRLSLFPGENGAKP